MCIRDRAASAATVTDGEVVRFSVPAVRLEALIAATFWTGAETFWTGAETPADALRVRMIPEDATATAVRRPTVPVTTWPKADRGVVGRRAARCRAPMVH